MKERQRGIDQSPLPDPKTGGSFVNTVVVPSLLGMMAGGPTYLGAKFLTDEHTAQRWGLGVGVGTATAGAGFQLSRLSNERAKKFAQAGRKLRSRFERARAMVESAAGLGATGGIISLATENVAPVIVAGLLGVISANLDYKERAKSFPELITPEGNSVKRDLSFPESVEGHQYPPVFQADTLADVLEFREANKERIIRWVGRIIPERSNNPDSVTARPLATSVFIIKNVRHFPAYDSKDGEDMRLFDTKDINAGVIVHPNKHTFMTWPRQTIFEDKVVASTYFNSKYWQAWREISWNEKVIMLVQYQTSDLWDFAHSSEKALDNYWLLDILTDKPRPRRGVRRRVPQPQGRPIPTLALQHI